MYIHIRKAKSIICASYTISLTQFHITLELTRFLLSYSSDMHQNHHRNTHISHITYSHTWAMVSKESWLSGCRETHLHLAIVALRIAVPLFSHKDVVALRIAVPLLHVNALPGFSCSGVTYRRPTTNTRCPRVTAIPS